MDKIHKNLKEARIACDKYLDVISLAGEKHGVYEECEDSCAAVYIKAKYYSESGEIKTYYHDE